MAKRLASRIGSGFLIALGSVLITLVLLEIMLRLFFPVSDIPVVAFEPGVGVHLAPNQTGTVVIGATGAVRGRYRVNRQGWNSLHEYTDVKPMGGLRVAIIGDSYVEALQVDVDKAFPALVEQALRSDPACAGYSPIQVYSFGYSGAPLSQYLSMMRHVDARYRPDVHVITIIENDFDESIVTRRPHFTPYPHFLRFREDGHGRFEEVAPEPYRPSPIRRFMLNFALVRYLYLNLDLPRVFPGLHDLFRQRQEPHAQAATMAPEAMARLTRLIFSDYQRIAQAGKSRLSLIMDADRNAIYGARGPSPKFALVARIASDAAASLGIDFVDLTPVFAEDYRRYGEPFNSRADTHWNERGHQVVAGVVTRWVIENVCRAARG